MARQRQRPRNEPRSPLPRAPLTPADPDARFAAWLGERARRLALGLTAALVTLRAYWPSEADPKTEGGQGLVWVAAVLAAAGLALASALIGGRLTLRVSWTDLGVITLTALVGLSTHFALDHRIAVNLAWEWGAVGLAFLLLRNLPKTRAESVALSAALVATAVALAAYGLYQAGVELEQMRQNYLRDPRRTLLLLHIVPGSPAQAAFENRLLQSNEPWSTFGLPNSLAGFLVGPLVLLLAVGWENLIHRDEPGKPPGGYAKGPALALAAVPAAVLLVCLLATKSRSAWIGLAVGVGVVLARSWRGVRTRTLAVTAALGLLVVGALVAGGLATGRLDRLVLTESTKSLRYRAEYWEGTWRLITRRAGVFWHGVGPGNFGWAYLRYKLPQSSEEIRDPHNLILEAWSTAGIGAALALVAALGLAGRDLFGRSLPSDHEASLLLPSSAPDAPPSKPGWIVLSAGAGLAWMAFWSVVILFEVDLLMRWVLLVIGWLVAVGGRWGLWHRRGVSAGALGAAGLAMTVNLLAAGGIGMPAVAVLLWGWIALGLNLRDDRPCGRPRAVGGRAPAFVLAVAWAALSGLFAGSAWTYWQTESALGEAEAALRARPPEYARARAAYLRAAEIDPYSPRPWLGLAQVEERAWRDRGGRAEDRGWVTLPTTLAKAVELPRNPNAWGLHHERALLDRALLDQIGPRIGTRDVIGLRADAVKACRMAAYLYPTRAALHADLAEASAAMGLTRDAMAEAEEALRLDRLTPHPDKKLAPAVRALLEERLAEWQQAH